MRLKSGDLIFIIFFVIVLLMIMKTAALSFNPRTMGMLGVLFFVTVLALGMNK